METKEIIREEKEGVLIVVTKNLFSNGDYNYSVIQTNIRNGVVFGKDVYDTKRRLNKYLERYSMEVIL